LSRSNFHTYSPRLTLSRGRVHMTHVANDASRPRAPNHHTHTFPNGDSYVGEWRDGMIEVRNVQRFRGRLVF